MDKKELKKELLKMLMGDMDEMMGEEKSELFDGMMPEKKVTVAADSKEGLEKGLDKAQEILKAKMSEMEDMSEEESEDEEEKKKRK